MAECASGRQHSLYLDPLGYVWSCGCNQNGQLGLGHLELTLIPEKINNLPPIISISAGNNFSLFVDVNKSIWSCGNNQFGQLGLEDLNQRNFPEQIKNLPKIISAIALSTSSIFLDCEGSVWGCGLNQYGELGLGDTTQRNKAEKIQGLPTIKSIAAGYNHSLFLDCSGSVWSCGDNEASSWGLRDRKGTTRAENIEGLPKITSMAGGAHFSLFLDEEGNVWVCGNNRYGSLGLGHSNEIDSPQKNKHVSGIVAVAGGNAYFSMFLDKQGNVFTCGNNPGGQLGLGDKKDRHIPQKVNNIPPISSLSSCNTAWNYLQVVDCDGQVWGCGYNSGQLGVDHTNPTETFQRMETFCKPKGPEEIEQPATQEAEIRVDEKELFKAMEKEQSKELIQSTLLSENFHLGIAFEAPLSNENTKSAI